VPQGVAAATTEERLEGFVASRGLPPTALDVYRAARPHASPGDLLAAVLTDGFFRLPALAMVEARHRSPSWVYEFAWRTTHRDLGAAHAVDIPFVFDNLRAVGAEGLVGPDAPQSLADQMHATWVRFAAEGDPGWEPYGGERKVRVFDETGARTVPDPRGEERAAWR
jgi:para-nitrobenzyl esterase